MWTTKSDLFYVNPQLQIGLGYKYNGLTGNIHTLEGLDLKTGNSLWEQILNRQYGWNKIQTLNDSVVLITTGGLHSINIKNGTGWHYNTITGKKDYKETIAKNVAGIALGVLTGVGVFSSGPNLVSNIDSNTLIENSAVYFASKDSISKINLTNGTLIWSATLPKDLTSNSSIFIKDSTLYMINKGYAFWGRKKIPFGEPFILAMNKENGKQIYFNSTLLNENPIVDYEISDDTLLALFSNKLVKYSLLTGLKLIEKQPLNNEKINYTGFIGNNIFIKTTDSLFKNLKELDSTKIYLYANDDTIIAIDTNLNDTTIINTNQLFYSYLNYETFKFLSNGKQTIILNKNSQIVANLGVSYRAFLKKDTLLDFQDNSLLQVKLSDILKN